MTQFEGALKPSAIEVDAYEGSIWAHRFTQIESNQQGRWEYDESGNVIYAGYSARGITTSQQLWLLQKFTYSGGNVTLRQIAYDAWDNRATSASYA